MAACHRPVPTWFTISRAQYPPLISLNLFFGQRNRKSRRPVLFFCFYREIRERLRRRRRRNRRAPHNFAAIESIGNCNFRRVETVTSLRPISVFPRKKNTNQNDAEIHRERPSGEPTTKYEENAINSALLRREGKRRFLTRSISIASFCSVKELRVFCFMDRSVLAMFSRVPSMFDHCRSVGV